MSSPVLPGGTTSVHLPPLHYGALPKPGSPAFLTSLLTELRDDPDHGFDFDTTIFVGVFMCLIAKGANLIVEIDDVDGGDYGTSEDEREDLGLQRVMRMTELIVSNIFGLKSHCARIKPSRNADEALIHLFGQHAAVEREASRGPSVMSSVNGRKARDTHTTPRTPSSAHAHQNSIDATRLPQVLIVSDLEQGNRHTHLAIGDMLRSRKVCVSRREMGAGDTIEGLPTAREQPMPSSSTASQVPAEGRHVFDLPDDFICIWVRSTSIDAKTPPPWLVDRFAFKCRASQLAEPTVGINLHAAIPPEYVAMLRSLALKTHMHPPLRAHISNLFSALHGHPKLSANITSSSITSFKSFIRIARVLFRPFDWSPAEIDPGVKGRAYDQRRKLVERADWFATDDDIREVFGNLVEFRVRLRRASEEVMWPLKGGADGIELELANDSSRVRQRDFDHARLEQVHVQLILRRILDIV